MNRLECIEVLKETSKEIRRVINQRIEYLSSLSDEVFETYLDEYIKDLLVAPKPVVNQLAELTKVAKAQSNVISKQDDSIKSLAAQLYLNKKALAETRDQLYLAERSLEETKKQAAYDLKVQKNQAAHSLKVQADTIALREKELDKVCQERDALHTALKDVIMHNGYLTEKLNNIKEIVNG